MLQRSEEWFAARMGRVTASRISDILTGTADKRRNYMLQLAAEKLTGQPQESGFVSPEMQRGIDLEPKAKAAFTARTGIIVEETDFWIDIEMPILGASPDGLTNCGAVLECKAPKTTTHLGYIRDKELPAKYKPQVQCQLLVTGRTHAYFVSYDDRLPAHLQLFTIRVERDQAYIQMMRSKVELFQEELLALMGDLA